MRELEHEVEAYEDFVEYRKDEAVRCGQSYQSAEGWKPALFSFGG